MINRGTSTNVVIAAGLVVLVLLAGRSFFALGDFTYFFVAGTDFVNADATPAPVWVQPGQGYDGQFFYRYSLDPFDFSKTNYGVTVDLVPYRMQRIVYPALVWMFTLGGIPGLVPIGMVLVNIFAFFGIIFFAFKLSRQISSQNPIVYAPLLLCGLLMSLARCLSEVTELCFFMGAMYFLFKRLYLQFVLFGTLTVLSRETALIALLPLTTMTVINLRKSQQLRGIHFTLLIPFMVYALWKMIIYFNTGNDEIIQGTGNLGWPVLGMIGGIRANLDVSSTKNILQLIFYVAYFCWQIMLAILVFKSVKKKFNTGLTGFELSLAVTYITWLIFALFLSAAIYVDDWSFMRVFVIWNMTGFVLIACCRNKLPRPFLVYSGILVVLTIARLIIRP